MTAALGFLLSPAGRILAAVLAAVLAIAIAYNRGESAAEARCEVRAVQAALDAAKADLAEAQRAAEREDADAAILEAQKLALEGQVNELRASLSSGSACVGDDDFTRRLHDILNGAATPGPKPSRTPRLHGAGAGPGDPRRRGRPRHRGADRRRPGDGQYPAVEIGGLV